MGRSFPEIVEFITNYAGGTGQEQEVVSVLTQFKVLGREPAISNQLTPAILDAITRKFVLPQDESVSIVSIPREPTTTIVEGLTIIANALVINNNLLKEWHPDPQLFSYVLQLYNKMNVQEGDLRKVYLFGRVLFLITFDGLSVYTSSQSDLIEKSTIVIDAKMCQFEWLDLNDQMPKLAFIELLKFFFNVVHFHPVEAKPKDSTLRALASKILVNKIGTPSAGNVDISRHIFNDLMCISGKIWFGRALENGDCRTNVLSSVLTHCRFLTDPATKNLYMNEASLSPALTCLQIIVSYLWASDTIINDETEKLRQLARTQLFPTSEDRRLGVGEAGASSLASRLVALTREPTLTNANRIAQEIYWQMCGRDANKVSSVMGFGYGSAYLASTFITGSGDSSKNDKSHASRLSTTDIKSDDNDHHQQQKDINLVTGQTMNPEEDARERGRLRAEWSALSDAEKQQESEKMYGLFEKLKKNGIFQIQNNPFDSSNFKK
jgi:hypothetical protein